NVAAQVVDWNGQPAILSTQHEITERKLAEEAASNALARLRDAVECIPGGFFLLDPEERLVLWNTQLGKDFPDMLPLLKPGMPFATILRSVADQVDRGGVDAESWQRQRLGQFRRAESGSSQLRFRDGRWFQLLDRRTSDGGRVCMRLEITDHKRQEQELRQAQKVEALGQLTGGIAHDFNNLLQVISGYTQLCMQQAGPSAVLQRQLRSILEAANKASQLTQQLRTFSRKQMLNPEVLNLNQVLEELATLLAPLLGEHLQLHLDQDPGLAPLVADRGMVEQVAMNLVINARDAMPDGGQITLQTRNALLDEAACRGQPGAEPGKYVLLACADSGVGMSPEVLEHIFEPFFTTKEAGKGTGLGLATVYGIVRQHKGVLQVSSQVGGGTRFHVYLPCQDLAPRAQAVDAQDEAPGGNQTILIAEDSAAVRDLLAQMLRERGYEVISTEDGEAAVEQFRRHADRVDLVILDVVMPRMKGVEALTNMRRIKPGVRALFTSGWYGEVEERQLRQHGAALLYKPYTPATLLWTVHQVLGGAAPGAPRDTGTQGR
ncbi:MAG TPA: ATP-binding protein, partial [bacterium]|nr:ATP-binding protein [bacterium]